MTCVDAWHLIFQGDEMPLTRTIMMPPGASWLKPAQKKVQQLDLSVDLGQSHSLFGICLGP